MQQLEDKMWSQRALDKQALGYDMRPRGWRWRDLLSVPLKRFMPIAAARMFIALVAFVIVLVAGRSFWWHTDAANSVMTVVYWVAPALLIAGCYILVRDLLKAVFYAFITKRTLPEDQRTAFGDRWKVKSDQH